MQFVRTSQLFFVYFAELVPFANFSLYKPRKVWYNKYVVVPKGIFLSFFFRLSLAISDALWYNEGTKE